MSVYKGDDINQVQRCLTSLLNQTVANEVDIYVAADGPISNELSRMLTEYCDSGKILLRSRDENLGLAKTLNELLELVLQRGYEYIARMDADDEALPYRFEKQLAFLKVHPNIDVVGGWIKEINKDGNVVKYPLEHDEMKLFHGKRDCMAHPTVMFRRSYFEKAGLYPTDFVRGEDSIMWLKGFLNGCRFANLPDILVNMQVDESLYKRRSGAQQSYSDYLCRKKIIKELGLSRRYYIIAWARYLLFKYSSPTVLRLAYKYFR